MEKMETSFWDKLKDTGLDLVADAGYSAIEQEFSTGDTSGGTKPASTASQPITITMPSIDTSQEKMIMYSAGAAFLLLAGFVVYRLA